MCSYYKVLLNVHFSGPGPLLCNLNANVLYTISHFLTLISVFLHIIYIFKLPLLSDVETNNMKGLTMTKKKINIKTCQRSTPGGKVRRFLY